VAESQEWHCIHTMAVRLLQDSVRPGRGVETAVRRVGASLAPRVARFGTAGGGVLTLSGRAKLALAVDRFTASHALHPCPPHAHPSIIHARSTDAKKPATSMLGPSETCAVHSTQQLAPILPIHHPANAQEAAVPTPECGVLISEIRMRRFAQSCAHGSPSAEKLRGPIITQHSTQAVLPQAMTPTAFHRLAAPPTRRS
jgi:hypothetical protein